MSLLSALAFVARTTSIFNASNASNSLNNKYEPGNVLPVEDFMLTGKKSSLRSSGPLRDLGFIYDYKARRPATGSNKQDELNTG
ncbi:hypothetical protein Zmor_002055 [Zophobas morio]|uniref:Uncharacterized protein n=1 Tax=Zophobas morio TaxID=2755281 RepID=A0AA38MPS4_9CUCU|nr:hypothetical protein Zmor_002055 [Zophobas morio]